MFTPMGLLMQRIEIRGEALAVFRGEAPAVYLAQANGPTVCNINPKHIARRS